jgi:hypothetical protein
VPAYNRLYQGNYAPGFYAESMKSRLDDLRLKYGLHDHRPVVQAPKELPKPRFRQLDLFAAA